MTASLVSLAVVLFLAFVLPLLVQSIPGKPFPEAVVLLAAGAVFGPHLLGWIAVTPAVNMLSELGLAFLFLLAGYDLDPAMIRGHQGKVGLLTWVVTFAIATVCVGVFPFFGRWNLTGVSASIILTTTALGTLMPILAEKGLTGTPVGDATVAYGLWGELAPVVAMAVMLSARRKWQTILVLDAFAAVCALVALLPRFFRRLGRRLASFLDSSSGSVAGLSPRLMVRGTVLLLVGLVALSEEFRLDAVLGAFGAGFILRYVAPEGDETLNAKIDGIANGFLVPVFFVVSGCGIDIKAVGAAPGLLTGFVAMLLIVRALPVYVALSLDKPTRSLSQHSRLAVALYCATALPVIVAVTNVAVAARTMSRDVASALVAAGAVTVLVMPLLSQLLMKAADEHPVAAVEEIAKHPHEAKTIIKEHAQAAKMLGREEWLERRAQWAKALAKDGVFDEARHAGVIVPSAADARRFADALDDDEFRRDAQAWIAKALAERSQRLEEMGLDARAVQDAVRDAPRTIRASHGVRKPARPARRP